MVKAALCTCRAEVPELGPGGLLKPSRRDCLLNGNFLDCNLIVIITHFY